MGVERRLLVLLLLLSLAALVAAPAAAAPELSESANHMLLKYVSTPDDSFAWQQAWSTTWGSITVTDLVVTTQTWRTIPWQHLVRIYRPAEVAFPGWMTLFIAGGSGGPTPGTPKGEDWIAATISQITQAPVAVLCTVPNQPLFDNLREDALISYTFQEFLEDSDPTWPLLFPMVKSAVRTMDALQAFTQQEWGQAVDSFLVTGASKRGWTTWLTGAVDNHRVKAIAPMVIDVLNIKDQVAHQLEMWGCYSEMIDDYSSKGLTEAFNLPLGRELWRAVDPYTYRMDLRMPKLLLLGTNDPYWTTDALNLYWHGLQGPKCLLYDPNSGHGLDDTWRVVCSLCGFFRTVASGSSLPEMSWERREHKGQVTITIRAPQAVAARAWMATADNLDFRPQVWTSTEISGGDGLYSITITRPAHQNLAVFGEADFLMDLPGDQQLLYRLSTQNIIARK